MKQRFAKLTAKLDAISQRERFMIFAALATVIIWLTQALLIQPLLIKQKKLTTDIELQHQQLDQLQRTLETLAQTKKDNRNSPLHEKIRLAKEKIIEDETYIKKRRDTLVPPDKMGALLEQMLSQNGHLQLVALDTLDPTPMTDGSNKPASAVAGTPMRAGTEKLIYQHGVRLTVRGNYMDLLSYLTSLEKLPTQMLWGNAKMTVLQYPAIELTVTIYTLSLETTWLQV